MMPWKICCDVKGRCCGVMEFLVGWLVLLL